MVNYNQSIIYKLCCRDVDITEIYVGSTTNFYRRKSQHKRTSNDTNNKSYNMYVYQFIRENGDWSNFDMVIVEEFSATDKNDLHKRERHWIETLKATLNKVIPTRTDADYYQANKETILEKNKNYRQLNSDKIKEQNKQYYQNNRETVLENVKHYREENKDKVKECDKKKYEKNKEAILNRVKQHQQSNSDRIKEYKKQYWEKNKDILNEKNRQRRQLKKQLKEQEQEQPAQVQPVQV